MPERTSPGRRAWRPGVLALLVTLCCPVAGYCPPAPDAEALLTGAWAEYGTNHYPQAERIAREVLAAASDAETLAAAAQVLVLSRLEQGDFAGARTEAQRAGSDTLLKQVTEREHRYQEDMAGCRKAATEAPTSEARAEALLALGEAELRYGRLQAAREAFAGVSGQYPGTPAAAKAEARLALVAAASGDVEGIIQAAEAALGKPDAEAAGAAIVRATDALLLVGGCTDRALSWLAEIRARRPGSPAAQAAVYAQARVYDRQGDPQAPDTYREAACLMPESDLARRAVGDIADLSLRSGQGAAGQEMLTALAQAAPKLAGACWYHRGRLYAAQDPPAAEQAEAAWRQAVATGPTAPEALPAAEALVSLLVGGGRYSLATTFVEETEKAAGPGELAARCRYLLGEICRRRGYPVSAEQAYTAVLTKYPKSQQVWAATLGLQEVARAYLGDYQADRAEAVLARLGKRLEPGAGLPADLAAKARACLAEMRRSEAMAQNTRGYHLGAARLMAPLHHGEHGALRPVERGPGPVWQPGMAGTGGMGFRAGGGGHGARPRGAQDLARPPGALPGYRGGAVRRNSGGRETGMIREYTRRGMGEAALAVASLIILLAPVAGWGCWAIADPTALHVSTPGPYENAHTVATVTANFGWQGRQIDFYVTSQENFMPGSVNPVSAVTGPGGGVTTTYTSGADVGPICITARDRNDLHASASCWVTVLRVDGGDLWWFNGCRPAGYPVVTSLVAEGATTGTFHWQVNAGFEYALLSSNGTPVQELTETDNAAALLSVGPSCAPFDVSVHLAYNGAPMVDYLTHVRTPASLQRDTERDMTIGVTGGYETAIWYYIVDQFNVQLDDQIDCNEHWSTGQIRLLWWSNWPDFEEQGGPSVGSDPTCVRDRIAVVDVFPTILMPQPCYRYPMQANAVDMAGQRLFVGSLMAGAGVQVRHHWLVRYDDHGDHLLEYPGYWLPLP